MTKTPFLYLYPFLSTHLQVRPLTTLSRLIAQMMRTHTRVCLFGFGWYYSPFRESNCRKKHFFGGV